MAHIKTQQDYDEVILTHIEACNPCTLKSVINWCNSQGYGGSKMTKAFHNLKTAKVIYTDIEDFDGVEEIIVNLY